MEGAKPRICDLLQLLERSEIVVAVDPLSTVHSAPDLRKHPQVGVAHGQVRVGAVVSLELGLQFGPGLAVACGSVETHGDPDGFQRLNHSP